MVFTKLYFSTVLLVLGTAGAITLNNGRYEDVYIVIQDIIEENLELLDRIQDVFTDASKLLFTATKNQVYFGKIIVVVPKSWSPQTKYKELPALSSLETYINIETGRISSPHVRSKSYQCGQEGLAMYIQPSFLLQAGQTSWGKHANVIVHEWGHLRWGLFDEYPDSFGRLPKFYPHAGEWKPVRCSHKIQGTIGRGGKCSARLAQKYCNAKNSGKKMRSTCYFCPNTEQNEDVTASLMGYQFIEQLTMFCDKDEESVREHQRHNSIAPNAQNKFCNGKSAWEVMREHDDFKNSPETFPSATNTTPEFEFIQEGDIFRIFVLDVSGSMDGNRIALLKQAGEYIIRQRIAVGSWLGIVTFNSFAYRNIELTQLNSQEDRDRLINALPTNADGFTCIGCGINLAIQMFSNELTIPENGEIILISDGRNNEGTLDLARMNAINAKVKINTIAVSQQADTLLSDIAAETGGKSFTYLENGNFSFAAVFNEAISGGDTVTLAASQSVTLLSEKISHNVANTTFSIETGLGKNTSVTVLTSVDDNIHIQLNGPANFTKIVSDYGNSATIRIDDIAEIGEYSLTINTSASEQDIEYHVTSSPTNTTNDVVRVVSRLSKSSVDLSSEDLPVVFADVTKSNAPVINVTVTATAESATNPPCTLHMSDNGIDPDRLKNDGTYSCYILPGCLGSGRVQIKVKASGKDGETFLLYSNTGSAPQDANDTLIEETIVDSFQRNVVTEELYISNYINDDSVDTIAPGMITDVEINNIETETKENGENRNLTITWTATGDDKNQGQVASGFRVSGEQGYAIDETEDDFIRDEGESLTQSTDKLNIRPIIIGVSVTFGVLLCVAIVFLIVKKTKTQNSAVTDSCVSVRNDDSSMTKVIPFQSNHRKRSFASTSLPPRQSLQAFGISSPEIPFQLKSSQTNLQNETSVQTINCSNQERKDEIAVGDVATESKQFGIQVNTEFKTADQRTESDEQRHNDAQSKEIINDETIIYIEAGMEEFTEPDDYITQTIRNPFPVINIPFNMTNKCTSVNKHVPVDNEDVEIINSKGKHQLLQSLPPLPFSTDAKLDQSHPPPNMALHILDPSDYGTGNKPYAFPFPFSGVSNPLRNSKQTTVDEDEIDDILNEADAETDTDELQSRTDSQMSTKHSDYSSNENENHAFGDDNGPQDCLKDDETLVDKVKDSHFKGSKENVSEAENA
ncbi:calcium-activated chloride channel regulator 1-like isoform X2 [Ruditapes philippinarum]|uniref:calcium-activated chloride channel regulator 1-like isoform X2 n=1 Tax=Ruditapes philippinarum TaxID=129788 RepID=UPI00295A6B28|nr:calcium-activated chloride channel regulator 1-like isoform X2 [Ruditapes philippinarum]